MLQQRLLGVKVGVDEEPEADAAPAAGDASDTVTVYTVRRSSDDVETAPGPEAEPPAERAVRGFTRWNAADPRSAPRDRLIDGREAVTFLVALKNAIEDPTRILIDL